MQGYVHIRWWSQCGGVDGVGGVQAAPRLAGGRAGGGSDPALLSPGCGGEAKQEGAARLVGEDGHVASGEGSGHLCTGPSYHCAHTVV